MCSVHRERTGCRKPTGICGAGSRSNRPDILSLKPMTEESAHGASRRPKSQFRCIACASTSSEIGNAFRCPACGDLLEIVYPPWDDPPQAAALIDLWLHRRASQFPLDQSGVWRFREILPQEIGKAEVVTLY